VCVLGRDPIQSRTQSHGYREMRPAELEDYSKKVEGGYAKSNGDQSNDSGYDTSKVYADTTAHQDNWLAADQSQYVAAGIWRQWRRLQLCPGWEC
jgi:hypothetical protein